MTAIPVPISEAHQWFRDHYAELASRARACVAHRRQQDREEAVAEILGVVFKACLSAHKRGCLHRVTPYHAVDYAFRQYRAGRRLAGTSSTDVMGEATQLQGRCKIVSLNSIAAEDPETRRPMPLSEVLADRRQDNNPLEHVRQNIDYPLILRKDRVSRKGRRVFHLLSQIRGQGAGQIIATELKVSPGRISQLKAEVAGALLRHDYGPPPQRPAHPSTAQCPRAARQSKIPKGQTHGTA